MKDERVVVCFVLVEQVRRMAGYFQLLVDLSYHIPQPFADVCNIIKYTSS